MSTSQSASAGGTDWSPEQYLLFRAARDRPIRDLMNFLGDDYAPDRIVDLGCGPGNSTEILRARFPDAAITGVDSSPAMIASARRTLPHLDFRQEDIRTFEPDPGGPGVDLFFSNAALHWLRRRDRIPTIRRLLASQPEGRGAVFAFQVPDNYLEPSHVLMRETAAAPGPWREHFERLAAEQQQHQQQQQQQHQERPELDPIEAPLEYYDALRPLCAAVETWTTRYVHVLDGHDAIVEWVKGTGLQPFLHALPEKGGVREAFLDEYRRRLAEAYPRARDGKVLLAYPRRFVVAYRN